MPRCWFRFPVALLVAACVVWLCEPSLSNGSSGTPRQAQANSYALDPQPTPFPHLRALPTPSLPPWVLQISPNGPKGEWLSANSTVAQVRVRFKDPLIPVEAIESADEQRKLQLFHLTPNVPGHFRFMTPRLVAFEPERELPLATRFHVSIDKGLSTLSGERLDRDIRWSFETAPISITLPSGDHYKLNPALSIGSNVELNLTSLQQRFSMVVAGGERIPVKLSIEERGYHWKPEPDNYDPNQENYQWWSYSITLGDPLQKASDYNFSVAPGVQPAWGNIDTSQPFSSQIETYRPLTFDGISQGEGGDQLFDSGNPVLHFTNSITDASAPANIHVSGINAADKPIDGGGRDIPIEPLLLHPDTSYRVTIDSNITDEFGQTLGQPASASFYNGDYTADFWVPEDFHIIAAQSDIGIHYAGMNLPDAAYRAAYKVLRPQDLVYFSSAQPSQSDPRQIFSAGLLPLEESWRPIAAPVAKNRPVDILQPTKAQLGNSGLGLLAYGASAATYRFQVAQGSWQRVRATYYGEVEITDLGVFAQALPDGAVVRVHHLSDGRPAEGASIAIYVRHENAKQRPEPLPCAMATTDASGAAVFRATAIAPCIVQRSQGDSSPPDLLAIARAGDDWAFTSFNLQLWESNIDTQWDWGQVNSRGSIFPDRDLYQPGETATFTATAFYLQHDALRRDAAGRYTLTLIDDHGARTKEGARVADEFGVFTIRIALNRKQKPGTYQIEAAGRNGNTFTGYFRVAEFKPPAFSLDLAADKDIAVAGETVMAHGRGQYLFGSPLTAARASWFVTRERWYPRDSMWARDWDGYVFGKTWIQPETAPDISHDVFKTNRTFDKDGRATQSVALAKHLPVWLTYTVELEASDAANRSVAQSTAFQVLPAPEVIGLRMDSRLVRVKEATSINVIVTDRQAKAVAGRRVRVDLQLQTVAADQTVTYTTLDSAFVVSAANPVPVKLVPPRPGTYRIRANFADVADDAAASDAVITAVSELPSPAPSPAARPTEPPIEASFSNDSPKPGDTESVKIKLPYQDADVYLAVLRQHTYRQTSAHVVGGSTSFAFSVTPDMAPNVFFEVQAVRRGAPHNGVTAVPGQTLSQVRFFGLGLNVDDRKLVVRARAAKPRLQPGTQQTLNFHVLNSSGKPLRAELTVAVVDDSVLRLTGYRPPDLFRSVWQSWIPGSLIAGDMRRAVLLEPLEQQLLVRYGFGKPRPQRVMVRGVAADVYEVNAATSLKSIGRIATRGVNGNPPGRGILVRTNFNVLAYYNGAVRTNNAGDASVTFKLPDSLTTWRVMVEAIGAPQPGPGAPDLRFGYGETTFLTHKPLAITPLLPQFARPHDRIDIGVNLTNDTGSTGNAFVRGFLQGPLAWANYHPPVQQFSTSLYAGAGTKGHRFAAQTTGWGTGLIEFQALLGAHNDAFQQSLPILPLEVSEHVVETGTTTASIGIPLNVDRHVDPNVGGLNVTLASSLLPEIIVPAGQVLDGLDIPLLEPTASRLSIAADLRVLELKFKHPISKFDPMQVAAEQLDHLVELQNSDGGFSYWPTSRYSDPWDSAYAAEALGQAVSAGVSVDPAMINGLRGYLDRVVDDPQGFVPLCDVVCVQRLRLDAMLGLQAIGELRAAQLRDVYALREHYGLGGQIRLARMLSITPGWTQQAKAATDRLQELVYETGRNASVDVPAGWWWYDSVTLAQSQMLRLFVAQRVNPEILDKVLRGLIGRQRNGAWLNHYDTAQALRAILDYARLEPLPPNFTATTTLAGRQINTTKFVGYEKTTAQVNVPMAQLPRNRSELVLAKSGTGRLHYVVEYGYRVKGAEKGSVNGFRLERKVTEANQQKVLSHVQLTPPLTPTVLGVAKVYDVELHVIVDHPVDRVIVTDPLPGGFEAIDQSFLTTTRYYQAAGWNWGFNYQTIYRDRVVLYADQLWPGSYYVHYLVRSVTPGMYLWPGASAYLLYAPEEFGRTASSALIIRDG